MDRISQYIRAFNPHGRKVGVGRSLIALGQASYLLFTQPQALVVPVLGREAAPYCDGIRAISLYCVGGGSTDVSTPHWVMFALLIVIVSGLLPGPSGLVHAWISFSLSASIALPDGGDIAATVITMLLLPICFTDYRLWAWTRFPRTRPASSIRQGIALATIWAIRVQVAVIYLDSGVSKMASEKWLNGSAEFYVLRDGAFGASGFLHAAGLALISSPIMVAVVTWGAMALEIAVGILVLFGRDRGRRVALIFAVLLHVGIILTIGLWSFALIMIGSVTIATMSSVGIQRRGVEGEDPSAADRWTSVAGTRHSAMSAHTETPLLFGLIGIRGGPCVGSRSEQELLIVEEFHQRDLKGGKTHEGNL